MTLAEIAGELPQLWPQSQFLSLIHISEPTSQAEKLAKRFDANTYIALTEAMNSHDIGRDRGGVAAALATISIPVVAVSIDTDRLFPPRLQAEIAELAPAAAPLVSISSPFGHDGFLVEVESVGNVIREALKLAK